MKKLIYLCCALMMGSVLFSSCGDDDEPSANNQGKTRNSPKLRMTTLHPAIRLIQKRK